ncbi:exo-1,3-beta-D-glucanase [Colletotrichum graminicola M1.001]|uniref:Exo-1,3-beta-D-glucanase n=1 Tax=Colletotrichum graminicola (strain M1.001 / M2 / FGSC 10212) TaxID=645133 RepID=E3R0H7_COLGM|nr:exo-1,3-beta-D-glucanase [Colletotrichum graminicola M1.001]EFQ36615.1 exo-1,3-beta-D-glucanase [Colletotrichum graminicola M1.001]
METIEMLFLVRGATAGVILMEWNVTAASQGAAAMWDSHFRVGHRSRAEQDWVADYDNEKSIYNQPNCSSTQIFIARIVLFESRGPLWSYGGGSYYAVGLRLPVSRSGKIF